MFAMLTGMGNFQNPASNASSAIVGLISLAVGITCLWLASESAAQQP